MVEKFDGIAQRPDLMSSYAVEVEAKDNFSLYAF